MTIARPRPAPGSGRPGMRVAPARTLAAVAAAFSRDLDVDLVRVETIVRHARQQAVQLLVLPAAALGGHLTDLASPDPEQLPLPSATTTPRSGTSPGWPETWSSASGTARPTVACATTPPRP